MPKEKKRKKEPVRMRTGKWPNQEDEEQLALESLPREIQEYMNKKNPDWDWADLFVDEEEWIVIRQYDVGKNDKLEETSRVAAVVKARKNFF